MIDRSVNQQRETGSVKIVLILTFEIKVFLIPKWNNRIPHATYFVKNLIQQIETHPHREALKADLQQNQEYNPFSDESKDKIQSIRNVEYFEVCEVSQDPLPSMSGVLHERDRVLQMRILSRRTGSI